MEITVKFGSFKFKLIKFKSISEIFILSVKLCGVTDVFEETPNCCINALRGMFVSLTLQGSLLAQKTVNIQ